MEGHLYWAVRGNWYSANPLDRIRCIGTKEPTDDTKNRDS